MFIRMQLTVLLFASSALLLTPAISTSETLFELYEIAVENDPTLNAATSVFLASKESKNFAQGGLYPEVDLTAEIGRNREDVEGTAVIGTADLTYFDSNYVQLQLKQPLYRLDVFSAIDIADAKSRAAAAEYELAQQNLIMRLADAYFAVLYAQDHLWFAEAEEQAIGKQLHNIERRYKAGKSTLTDLQEAESSHDLTLAQALIAKDDYDDSLEGLTQLTGLTHNNVARLSPDFIPQKLEPENLGYWIDLAERNNKKLNAERFSIQALKAEIKNQNSGHHPTLDLVAQYRTEETGGRFGESDTDDRSIMLQLDVPLYKGGQTSSKVRTANINLNEAIHNLRTTHRSVMRETRKSFRTAASSLNRINALKRVVISAETALASITKGYEVGTRTSADVLDAQHGLFKAQKEYSADKYRYLQNYLLLKNLIGSLNKEDVTTISQWFK